jgi:hypothetical protein
LQYGADGNIARVVAQDVTEGDTEKDGYLDAVQSLAKMDSGDVPGDVPGTGLLR